MCRCHQSNEHTHAVAPIVHCVPNMVSTQSCPQHTHSLSLSLSLSLSEQGIRQRAAALLTKLSHLTVSVRLMMWKFLALPANLFLMAATASLGPVSVSLTTSHTSRWRDRFPALAALSVARSAHTTHTHTHVHTDTRTHTRTHGHTGDGCLFPNRHSPISCPTGVEKGPNPKKLAICVHESVSGEYVLMNSAIYMYISSVYVLRYHMT